MPAQANNFHSKKVLILGGGFGGIKVALELAKQPAFNVTLLSDQKNFRYYPTLYNVAVGKNRLGASIALSEIFTGKNVKVIQATALKIDRENKSVKDSAGKTYPYDDLVIALGVVTNFFGIKGLDKYAYGVKTVEEAERLKAHLHKHLVDEQEPDVNYVIIGGGPTGVELAGALPGYIHHIMKKHGIADKKIHVDLVEAAPRLVPRLPAATSHAIAKRLRRLGIKLYLNQAVQAETADSLIVSGHSIESHTVIWTAGVTNHPFLKANDLVLNEHGKAKVDQQLRAEPNIFVIGDNADTQYSGLAQTALYDGVFVAQNLKLQASNKPMRSYKAKKPIYVMPAGARWSAVLWGRLQLYGWLGYILRAAADFRGFQAYEPWWKASKHFLASDNSEENCPICTKT